MKINPQKHNTLNSLAQIYNMSTSTLASLLENLDFQNNTRVFTQKEVAQIVDFLGSPELINDSIDPTELNTNSKLAAYYNVSRKTFSKWIDLIPNLKQDNKYRYKYLPKEVLTIIKHLG